MTSPDTKHQPTGAAPIFYLSMLPGLVPLARKYGYALTLHGSLARDFDLVAIPWTEDAKSGEELIKAIMDATGARPRARRDWKEMPHGRTTYALYLGGGPYMDISVMPRSCDAQHHAKPGEVIHEESD